MRKQVGIIGAGPAGLMLSHLLHLRGIASVVLESRSRDYVEKRVRAGVLEAGTVDLLVQSGVGERLQREGLVHRGIELRFAGSSHRIDFEDLTGGKTVTVYGQQEVVKDLIAARLAAGGDIRFETPVTSIAGIDGESPSIEFGGQAPGRLACDYIVGCDGFHGLCRDAIPNVTTYDRTFPFAWLGILAHSPPVSHELIYTHHERGFALVSMRSPTVTRLYLQCAPDEDATLWPDERFWNELRARLAGVETPNVVPGEIVQKGVTAMRSFVAEPMQYGRLFLAGDAAHIVPPTGAKGMNLAIADVRVLSAALVEFYASGRGEPLAAYGETCLRRVWLAQRFSVWMTSLLHRFDAATPYDRRLQAAEQQLLIRSRAAARTLAENYVGLPFE